MPEIRAPTPPQNNPPAPFRRSQEKIQWAVPPPIQAPVGRKSTGNPSAKPRKPEPYLRIKSGVPLKTGDS